MWIKTQQGELLNADKLLRIKVRQCGGRKQVIGALNVEGDRVIALGEFNTHATAKAYLDELGRLLTGKTSLNFGVTGDEVNGLSNIRDIPLRTMEADNNDA